MSIDTDYKTIGLREIKIPPETYYVNLVIGVGFLLNHGIKKYIGMFQ
jgi:hypothetical protein